jgi:hypothetical protein
VSDLRVAVSLVLALVLGFGAGAAYERGHPVLALVLGLAAAPFVLVVLARLVIEVAGELAGWLVLLLLPLLVFPGVRRWLRNRRAVSTSDPDRGRAEPRS